LDGAVTRGHIGRRDFLRASLLTAGAVTMGPAFWRDRAFAAAPTLPGPGPYGALLPPDANGLRLPPRFSSRIVARGLVPVLPAGYVWHIFSDGSASYATPDGGWILVSNSEAPATAGGGASALRFSASGEVVDAYRILGDTDTNCAGGPTPWGTWLSCEEHDGGYVWECDPTGAKEAVKRPGLGKFKHEAACVDPVHGHVYLTEDLGDGNLYRFTPKAYPDLSEGVLATCVRHEDGTVTWVPLPDPEATRAPTRKQVAEATVFKRGEGIFFDSGFVYVATTSDEKVWAYDTVTETLEVLYDGKELGEKAPLHAVDNVTVIAAPPRDRGRVGGHRRDVQPRR
jgi:hypothetical protein